MPQNRKSSPIQIEEDMAFTRSSWRVERIGWVIFGIVTLAAVLGFTGSGPLNQKVVAKEQILVQYKPFARQLAPTSFDLVVKSDMQQEVLIERNFLSNYQIDTITPEPEKVTIDGEYLRYQFNIDKPSGKKSITFHLTPQKVGYFTGRIQQINEEVVQINQLVYP